MPASNSFSRPRFDVTGPYEGGVRKIRNVLMDSGRLYRQGDRLLILRSGGIIISPNADQMADISEEIIDFIRTNRYGDALTRCPRELAARFLSATHIFDEIPEVESISRFPRLVLRSSGGLSFLRQPEKAEDVPTYDRESKTLIEYSPSYTKVPAQMRQFRNNPNQAANALWHPIQHFPFVDSAHRGAALALLLTAVMRPSLPLSPGFLISAPNYGVGKTLLAQVASLLAGGDAEITTNPEDEGELDKRILALLMALKPAVIFDNLSGYLQGDILCAQLTAPIYEGRILGHSSISRISNRTLWMFTGVNVHLRADTVRRFIIARMDPQDEAPERRQFAFHPLEYTRAHLSEMRAAAMALIWNATKANAWEMVQSQGTRPLGSYPDWDAAVRATVLWVAGQGWLDVADPVLTQEQEREMDSEAEQARILHLLWYRVAGEQPITVREFMERARKLPDPFAWEWRQGTVVHREMEINRTLFSAYEDLMEAQAGSSNNPRAVRFQWFINRMESRIQGGIRAVRGPRRGGGQTIYLEVSEKAKKSEALSIPLGEEGILVPVVPIPTLTSRTGGRSYEAVPF